MQQTIIWTVVLAFFSVWTATVAVPFLRRCLLPSLALATVMAAIYVAIAGVGLGLYDYGLDDDAYGVDQNAALSLAFPWAGFSLGLVAAKAVFQALFPTRRFDAHEQAIAFVVFWAVIMIVAERVGRHRGDVTNVTGTYPDLGLCDCLHAPAGMKAFYFSIGGVFFLLDEVVVRRRQNGWTNTRFRPLLCSFAREGASW